MATGAELAILLTARDTATTVVNGLKNSLGGLGGAASAPAKGFGNLASGIANFTTKAGLAVFGAGQLVNAGASLVGGLFDQNVAFENASAQIMAFTKDAGKTGEILSMIKERAALTPFAFNEMASAAAGLIPASNQANMALEDMIQTAEILAASNPAEGLEGAAFALREAVSGDFTSVIERFNLPRTMIAKLKEEGLPNIEIVRRAMLEMGYDTELVSNLANTASGRWSTFMDTLNNLKAAAMQALFEALSKSLAKMQVWLDANSESITAVATALGGLLARGLTAAISGIATLVKWGLSLFDSFGGIGRVVGLVRDAVLTFAAALRGDWTNADGIHPLHQAFGRIGTVIREQVIPFVMQLVDGFQTYLLPIIESAITLFARVASAFGEGGIGAALATLGEEIQRHAGVIFERLLALGAALVDWIEPYIGPALAKLAEWGAAIGSWIVDVAVPMLAEKAANLATAFLDWVYTIAPPLLAQLGELLGQIGNWIADVALPALGERLMVWVPAFVEWVGPVLGQLLTKLGELLVAIGTWIVTVAAPAIGAKLLEWGRQFLAWVGPQIGPMLGELGVLLQRLGGWITDTALPVVVAKVKEWGPAFLDWVATSVLPYLLERAGAILTDLSNWVTGTALPALIAKAQEWGPAFLDWVATSVLPTLKDKAQAIVTDLSSWATDTALPALIAKAKEWGPAFLDWVATEVVPKLAEKLDAIVDKVKDWIGAAGSGAVGKIESAAKALGSAAIDGIKSGITGAWATLTGALDSIVTEVKNKINAAIGLVNSGINAINGALEFEVGGVDMPGAIPDLPSVNVNPPDIPTIPLLAKGGIVTRPTLAVVGEAGPEAVVPLSGPHAGGVSLSDESIERLAWALRGGLRDALAGAI